MSHFREFDGVPFDTYSCNLRVELNRRTKNNIFFTAFKLEIPIPSKSMEKFHKWNTLTDS
jgi:hypothetical protein